jgi:peptidoglycan/LPS O-acetylase OafA/YrhL
MPSKETFYFKNLDALRFFGFFGVFLQHTITLPHGPVETATVTDLFCTIFSFAYFEVPFFFTLSSFLITYRILDEYRKENRMYLFKFYIRRGLRVWPLYFFYLMICFLALPSIASITGTSLPSLPLLWPFLFFWSNFYMIHHGVGFIFALIPLWSIAVEEQFYFLWGLCLKIFKKHIYIVISIGFLISIAFCYYYLYELHQTRMNMKLHSLFAVTDFCTGALLAIACIEKNKIFVALKRLPAIFFVLVYLFFIGYFVLQNYNIINPGLVITSVFNSICFALILFDQAFNEKRVFNAGYFKSFNYLGRISFGLYIYHELIVTLAGKLFPFFSGKNSFAFILLQECVTLAITVLIAHVSYRYFESYFLKLKDRF